MENAEEEGNKLKNALIQLCRESKGNREEIYNLLKHKNKYSDCLSTASSEPSTEAITILDEIYPARLKEIYEPPFVIFYKGNVDFLSNGKAIITVINDNLGTKYSFDKSFEICNSLKGKAVICFPYEGKKNMAFIKQLLDNGHEVIAILQDGFIKETDSLYEELCEKGLVLTICPENLNFKNKNRKVDFINFVGGIADHIVIGSLTSQSPCAAIVGVAVEQGKRLCSLPYPAGSNYLNNLLIKRGSRLIETGEDIFDERD